VRASQAPGHGTAGLVTSVPWPGAHSTAVFRTRAEIRQCCVACGPARLSGWCVCMKADCAQKSPAPGGERVLPGAGGGRRHRGIHSGLQEGIRRRRIR
jgi:hypothetical protein